MKIPASPALHQPDPPPAMTEAQPAPASPRLRRLQADFDQMQRAFKSFDLIRLVAAQGDPPELYRLDYEVAGLEAGEENYPVPRDHHRVEIQLPADYPRVAPLCRMLTPVFHPNINPSHICVADHWTAGERLVDLAIRIGEIIAYQAYNIKSPLDAVAARWTDFNAAALPIDPRPLRPPQW